MAAQPKPEDMRDRLLRAATRLFARRGFEATTLKQIADEVGIRAPSLLHHFSSKDALRNAVVDACVDEWRRRLPQLLAAATSADNRFDLVVSAVAEFLVTNRDLGILFCREALDRPEKLRELLTREVYPWVMLITNYIRKGQQDGTQRADIDPDAYVVNGLVFLLASAGASAVFADSDELVERHMREMFRVLHAGLFYD